MPPDLDLPSCNIRRCVYCPKDWNPASTCIEADAIAVEALRARRQLASPDHQDLDEYDLAHPDEIWTVIAPDTES